jgi:DNA-binding transcriptional MerR regulator
MTTERTHLSIGEVLSLLQPEFPDITISKIRFLESQGLLDPERTPSGYRKFHDDDIERLRWILTQQRDHFLPLKVIKDRLASGDLGSGAPEGVLPLAAESSTAASGEVAPAPGAVATIAEPEPVAERPAAEPTESAAPAPTAPAATNGSGAGGEASGNGTDPDPVPDPVNDESPAPDSSSPAAAAGHDRAEAVAQLVEGPPEPEVAEEPAPVEQPEAAEVPTKGRRRHPTGHQPGAPTPEPGDDPEAAESGGVTLTLDELVERSGMSAREIGELERYGLIAAEPDSQGTVYDEEALVVARLAAGFNRYGIEPRHLRMYKVAAEREAGLFEQLISPLLKQRRASARQQAVEMLEDLAELADDLRAAMVRSALREYLGGS